MNRLQMGWKEAEENVKMLELELEKLTACQTKLQWEAREAEYQVC